MRQRLMRALFCCANRRILWGEQKLPTPYVQNFNVNVQQALGEQCGFSGWVRWNERTKLFRFRDINQPRQAQITAADLDCVPDPENDSFCPSGYGVPRVFPDAPQFYINQEESASSSILSLVANDLEDEQLARNSQLNFVWSHAIDDASDSEDSSRIRLSPPTA